MLKFISILSVLCVISLPVAAQTAFPCNQQVRVDAIAEPWDQNTATFANDAVRVVVLDVIEPAAASYFLLIMHPPYDVLGMRTCSVIAQDSRLGYAAIFFNELEAKYDPATGLTLQVPAVIYLPEQSFQNSTLLTILVNQSTGDVTVTQALAE